MEIHISYQCLRIFVYRRTCARDTQAFVYTTMKIDPLVYLYAYCLLAGGYLYAYFISTTPSVFFIDGLLVVSHPPIVLMDI